MGEGGQGGEGPGRRKGSVVASEPSAPTGGGKPLPYFGLTLTLKLTPMGATTQLHAAVRDREAALSGRREGEARPDVLGTEGLAVLQILDQSTARE